MQEGKPISLHEFLYPLMVGYDSVTLDVDAELGGSDQEFNMLSGGTCRRGSASATSLCLPRGSLRASMVVK